MHTAPPKKMLAISILGILKRHTDEEHRLSQQDIIQLLAAEHNLHVDRKAVRRNLTDLMEYGFPIEHGQYSRCGADGEVETLATDWYIAHDFSDAELRMLIDSLLFSRMVTESQRTALIEKLQKLTSRHFRNHISHIRMMPHQSNGNRQLFYTIEVLDEAISRRQQVSFLYNDFGIDKKLHPRTESNGSAKRYLINPYQMAAVNGRYYLICNYDKYDNVANYRLDRITEIELLSTPAKPMALVRGLEQGLNLSRHMAEHIYMFSGERGTVTFRAERYILNDLIDWFGEEIRFLEETEDALIAQVQVSLEAMRLWAMQYAVHVRILSPESLVEEVKE